MEQSIIVMEALLLSLKLVFTNDILCKGEIAFSGIWFQKKLYLFAAVFLILFLILHKNIEFVIFQYIDVILTLILIGIIDFKYKIIPDSILICFAGGQLLYSVVNIPMEDLAKNIGVGLIVFGILALVSILIKGRFGMGDAKLIGILTIFTGWGYTLQIIFWGLIVAFFCIIVLLAGRKLNMKSELPFIPFLALGIILHSIFTII